MIPLETKHILEQYTDAQARIKDILDTIDKLNREMDNISKLGFTTDTVKGTRKDGSFGNIKVEGFYLPEYADKKRLLQERIIILSREEYELLLLTNKVEEYIQSLQVRMRRIITYKFLDKLTWLQVALKMGNSATADSIRMEFNNFILK